jgi:uncharacterized integral membrane protein
MATRLSTIFVLALLVLLPATARAQDDVFQETFFTSGKMPVVISVIGVILLGFFIYLFLLDRKIGRLENQLKK